MLHSSLSDYLFVKNNFIGYFTDLHTFRPKKLPIRMSLGHFNSREFFFKGFLGTPNFIDYVANDIFEIREISNFNNGPSTTSNVVEGPLLYKL